MASSDTDSTRKLSNELSDEIRKTSRNDDDAIATRRSVYDDPEIARLYWPKDDYENIHRFDPTARWTYREEQSLVRKIDWKVMAWAALSFSALNIDRGNLTQANTDNFLPDLNLSTNDFNWGNSIFRLAFLCAELPSQLVSKRVGPDRWIPMQMVLWSIITSCQFWLTGRTSFFVTRALLGYIFTRKNELPLRLALFWMSSNLCNIVSSFIAFGVLHMRGVLGQAGWRGLLTLVIGVATFFRMPPSPTQTRTWYRPKGWFTEREEIIIVNRVLRDDPTKGDMHNREGLSVKRIWTAICDYDLWPLYFIGLMFGIPNGPPATYLTLSLRNLGFGTFTTNLLTIPSTVLGIVTMFGITAISEVLNERTFVSMIEDLWTLPYTHPIQVGWCSRNAGAVASRTVNAFDYTTYRRGNLALIVICCFNIVVLYPGTKAYYIWRNRQRDRIWNAMSVEERKEYLETTKDMGNRRLDFRFAH
ncbi:MFS general substrate transporter [Gymnopus androsaceus JB14]|uniref:MFS general substrate transporter n=1 Tax=Gymnopus androsaceus JB14 TaxID=1447944 RepID=A0A6A4HFI5_9AGAR|nr:MFS general substrate transporter [Gymnopus androsaceus JB14]